MNTQCICKLSSIYVNTCIWRLVYRTCVFVFFLADGVGWLGWGGLGWGGLITFNGTSTHTWCYASDLVSCTCTHTWCYATDLVSCTCTHTWCYASDLVSCTCTHTWCYATDLVSCTCTHTNGNGAGKTMPVPIWAVWQPRLFERTCSESAAPEKKPEKSDFFVLSLWRNANPSKNKASWNSLFLLLAFTKACKYKWKMRKK